MHSKPPRRQCLPATPESYSASLRLHSAQVYSSGPKAGILLSVGSTQPFEVGMLKSRNERKKGVNRARVSGFPSSARFSPRTVIRVTAYHSDSMVNIKQE